MGSVGSPAAALSVCLWAQSLFMRELPGDSFAPVFCMSKARISLTGFTENAMLVHELL